MTGQGLKKTANEAAESHLVKVVAGGERVNPFGQDLMGVGLTNEDEVEVVTGPRVDCCTGHRLTGSRCEV